MYLQVSNEGLEFVGFVFSKTSIELLGFRLRCVDV